MNPLAPLQLADYTDPVFDGPSDFPVGPLDSTIALVTMTKNGALKLPRLFESVIGFVDRAIILDTGSTDSTLEWLLLQSHPFPVESVRKPFVDFAASRNQLFEFAQGKADWLLLLDDDMFLNFTKPGPEVRAQLLTREPAYMLRHAGDMAYWVSRLVRGALPWKYSGVTHEYLVGVDGSKAPHLEGVEVGHIYNHGPEKFERDLRLLSADIARDPEDARTIFYLANTLRDMGVTGPAIRFYCMRANMAGWDQETWQASYEAARLAVDPNAMGKVYFARPSRAEPAAWLARYYEMDGNASAAEHWEEVRASIPMTTDVLFVIQSAYGPRAKNL